MIDKKSTLYYKFSKMKDYVRFINQADVALEAFEDDEILHWKRHFIKSEAFEVIENMCSEIEYYMSQYNEKNADEDDEVSTKANGNLNKLLV